MIQPDTVDKNPEREPKMLTKSMASIMDIIKIVISGNPRRFPETILENIPNLENANDK